MENAFTKALLGLVLWLPLAAYNGFVIAIIWGWYMVPLFGLPPVTWAGGVGLALLSALLTFQIQNYKTNDEVDSFWFYILAGALRPTFSLAAAWVYISVFGV